MADFNVTAANMVIRKVKKNKENHKISEMELTWYVSVTILKGMEVVHEFFYGDLKGLKQASVFKEPVRHLVHKDQIVREPINITRLD